MSKSCIEISSGLIIKYQRAFLGLIALAFIGLVYFETRGYSYTKGQMRKVKAYTWHTMKTSVGDMKASVKGVKSSISDMVRHFEEEITTSPWDSNQAESDRIMDLDDDDLEPGEPHGSHLNMGPIRDDVKTDMFRNETEWDVPKHWLPSYEQKHQLQSHSAIHPLHFDQDDVLVFIHIPKTSGKTFNTHLVRDMKVSKEVQCHCKTHDKPHGCKCLNSRQGIWLFTRLTTAWPCGVHPSWSDLTHECLERGMDRKEKFHRKRRYSMVTMLRSPYTRYISEWHQVKERGQWKPFQNLRCYPLSREHYCYDDDWHGVTLDQFLKCPTNPANNRQVRMIADLNQSNCSDAFDWLTMPDDATGDAKSAANKRYQYVTNNPILLSAMKNLRQLAFFGLEEYQRETEYLFSRTFGFGFKTHFRQTKTFSEQVVISSAQRQRIMDCNRLDLILYRYAKELFFKRLHESVKRKHVFFTDNVEFSTHSPSDVTKP